MANLLDRRALKSIFDTANEIRKADQRPVERQVTVYVAREDREGAGKPPLLVTKAHNAIHTSAVAAFSGVVMHERLDGLVATFADPFDAVKAGLHALHAIDLMSDVLVLRGSHVAVGVGKASVVERPFREISGEAVERATKVISRAPLGSLVVEQSLLASLRPLRYGDIEVLEPRKGKLPGLGNVTTVTIRALQLKQELGDELEEVDAELRSRGRR